MSLRLQQCNTKTTAGQAAAGLADTNCEVSVGPNDHQAMQCPQRGAQAVDTPPEECRANKLFITPSTPCGKPQGCMTSVQQSTTCCHSKTGNQHNTAGVTPEEERPQEACNHNVLSLIKPGPQLQSNLSSKATDVQPADKEHSTCIAGGVRENVLSLNKSGPQLQSQVAMLATTTGPAVCITHVAAGR